MFSAKNFSEETHNRHNRQLMGLPNKAQVQSIRDLLETVLEKRKQSLISPEPEVNLADVFAETKHSTALHWMSKASGSKASSSRGTNESSEKIAAKDLKLTINY